jgi:hypothetical protein
MHFQRPPEFLAPCEEFLTIERLGPAGVWIADVIP